MKEAEHLVHAPGDGEKPIADDSQHRVCPKECAERYTQVLGIVWAFNLRVLRVGYRA